MRRLLRDHQTWLWLAAVVASVPTGLLATLLVDSSNALPKTVIGFLVLLGVAWWCWRAHERARRVAENQQRFLAEQRRRKDLRQQFALCKPVEELRPEDLGFQPLWPDQEADPRRRPFYPTYVSRRMALLDEDAAGGVGAGTAWDEAAIREALAAGRGFVLHGPPTMGKSRTLFEVVAGLRGWTVATPRRDQPAPPVEAFDTLFAGQRVVLLLEDLNDYAEATVDLAPFCGPDGLGRSARWVVAATCRDGPELGAVKAARSRSLRRFYDEIPLKLALLPQSSEEKGVLAKSAGRVNWDEMAADDYPTPGAIVMEDALVFMRGRFDDLPGDRRDVLRAIKLLTEAGVLPLLHRRVRAAAEAVLKRSVPHLADCLEDLADEAFLHQPGDQDPIVPEPAYLRDSVVRYAHGRRPQDDFRQLLGALKEIDDAYGATSIGYTYAATMNDHGSALEAYDIALALVPDDPYILVNRAASLHALGRFEEALADSEAALRHLHHPAVPAAFANRGAALGDLGRHEEALADLDASLELGSELPEILISRASALTALGRRREALEAVDAALAIVPDHPGGLSVRGGVLTELSRCDEALRDLDASLRLRPNHPKTNYNRGLALSRLGRYREALNALTDSLNAFDGSFHDLPDRFLVHYHRAMVLTALERDEEALVDFGAALDLRPNDRAARYNRGVSYSDLRRYEEALADFTAVLDIHPDDSAARSAREYALAHLGR